MEENTDVIVEEVVDPQVQETEATSNKEYNFRQLEEAKLRAERELAEEKIAFQELKSQIEAQKATVQEELKDDDFVEARHVKQMQAELARMKEESIQQAQLLTETRLKKDFPDIESVVTKENILKLKETNPRQYRAIYNEKDDYESAAIAYENIVKAGITTPQQDFSKQKEKMEKNLSKPISPHAMGNKSPINRENIEARDLSESQKKVLLDEMYSSMNRYIPK